jgi:hypothetical protein
MNFWTKILITFLIIVIALALWKHKELYELWKNFPFAFTA